MIAVALIASEPTWRSRLGGCSLALAAGLGALTLDLSPAALLEAGGTPHHCSPASSARRC